MQGSALKEKIFTGAIWSFIGSSGYQFFGLIVFILLSRQLSPEDFGVMALAIVFAETMNPLVRLGFTAGLVRQETIREESANTVFWLTLANGVFYAVLVYCLAPWVSRLMDIPKLEGILRMLAILPVFYALSTVQEAMLEHAYKFKAFAKRTLLASSISGVIAIVMALAGYGIYSLVVQRLASALLLMLVLWCESSWRPRWKFSLAEARALFHQGMPLMFSAFLFTATYRSKDLLVGAFLGTQALGFLRIVAKLNDFIIQFTVGLIASVSFTTFSKLQKDDAALRTMYLQLTKACGVLAFPAFFGMAAIAPEFIPFVFGEQWHASALLMQILCLASLSSALNYFYKPLMTALGKAGNALKAQGLEFLCTILLTTLMAQISLPMVMLGDVICYAIIMLFTLLSIRRVIGLKIRPVFTAFIPPIASSIIMLLTVLGVKALMIPHLSVPVLLPLLILCGVIAYGGSMALCFPRYTRTIRTSILQLVRATFKKNPLPSEERPNAENVK